MAIKVNNTTVIDDSRVGTLPTLNGSTSASGTLTLSSTSHATKGTVTVGDSNAGTTTIQGANVNLKVAAGTTPGALKADATGAVQNVLFSTK